MEDLFLKLVNMSITASWLVLAVIAVRLVFRKAPKWILCLLWGMVALRLICPFSIESGLSLIPSAQPLKQEIVFTPPPQQQARGEIVNSMGSVVLEQTLTAPARGEILDAGGNVVAEKELNPNSADPEQVWLFVLSRVWGLGVGLMALYALGSYLLLHRRVATAIPMGKNIKRSEFVDTPFVLGLFRPVIYLPACMEPGDIPYVVAHEQAHIRRRDHWWKPLGFALLSVYWFNPVLWAAYILLCRDIEAACDEKVIRDMPMDDRRAYSTALLHCSIHRRRIAACPLAFGEVGVKERVKSVMNYKKPAFWVLLTAVAVSVVVAVCFLTNPASQPVTMELDYVNRKSAFLKFHVQTEEDYQISPAYWLEVQEGGSWQKLAPLSEEQPAGEVVETASEEADYDAWSSLRWEDSYGPLADGTYRIRKDITIKDDSPYSAYAQFTVGGTAEKYVTYTLEDLTPIGAKLYEQENTDHSEQLVYNGDEGFWLEIWQDGQWQYLEPPEDRKPARKQDRHYIETLQYGSGDLELDWSALYGQLANGTYRIAREVTSTGEDDLRVCTAYAEFTLNRRVITWFDRDSANPEEQYPRETVMELPGMEGASVSYEEAKDEIRLTTEGGTQTVISSPFMMHSIFLTDLTGDGIWEICATIRTEETMQVQVYDAAQQRLYTLPTPENGIFVLTAKGDRLCVLEKDENWNLVGYGQLGLSDGALVVREVDPELRALTERVACVDIWTRKQVCLSSGEKREEILALLHALQNGVEPASREEVEAAQKDTFRISQITVQYELGQRNLIFSEDFGILWEYNSDHGYRVANPEPLREFVSSVTDGVRGKTAVGEPFAAMDAPWDWCAGIHSAAVESAQVHVCLYAYSNGSSSGSSSTNGTISYDTLEELIAILNRLPRDAFTPEKVVEGRTYRSILINQQAENTSVGIVDGVNNLGVVLNYQDGKVHLLLTDEMEKVKSKKETYLNPTQMWLVQDSALTEFMEKITEDPPVITYFVGSEYEWQEPLEISLGDSSVSLRLIEGWEYEKVENPTDSGIRCRPAGITEGWLYFSFWPEGYHPVEENRLLVEGFSWNWKTVTSYSDEAGTPTNLDVADAVWSYRKTELDSGDYVVINDGADSWFRDYRDQIDDTMMLTQIPGAED